jgi:hypothetical protein
MVVAGAPIAHGGCDLMKLSLAFALVLLAMMSPTSVFAADIDGKWVGKWVGKNEQIFLAFTFKAEGSRLTGTVENSYAPGVAEIQKGRMDGQAVSFVVIRDIGGADLGVEWASTLAGEKLTLHRSIKGIAVGEAVVCVKIARGQSITR